MRKSILLLLAIFSAQALAAEPESKAAVGEVKRDVCMSPGYAWAFSNKPDRYIKCLRLGETTILKVLDAGYRVTASNAVHQMSEVSTVVFIEKAD
ncbi:hypothetical protein [Sulfuricystis multivorans]|uniref:hypothetical protein n=1 Tax=Sulfuricystis multivorans TaxID=2211108 RepID=UPI000F84585F|nr:hypothetical protein [Sulfuricystis multivorans]